MVLFTCFRTLFAGPGGLTLANALFQSSGKFDEVSIFERFDSLRPNTGGGIQINGGASVLGRLGFLPNIQASSLPMNNVVSKTCGGIDLLALDVDAAVREDSAAAAGLIVNGSICSFTIMRDELSRILYDALPKSTVQFGKELTQIELTSDGSYSLCFADGSSDGSYDLVVGADGIRSKVRRFVVGCDDEAQYSGIRIRFGISPGGSRPRNAAGQMRQFFSMDGAYALTGSYGGLQGKIFDMIALTTYEDSTRIDSNAAWDTGDSKTSTLERLQVGEFPSEVTDVAAAATRFFDIGVRFQSPFSPWSRGGAVLMGDAAHAMPPFLGQGANQAIQDAYALSRCLEAGSPTQLALWQYELTRKPPTALLMLESRFLGTLETQRGFSGFLRNAFFFATDKLGIAKTVFLKGAVPRVPLD